MKFERNARLLTPKEYRFVFNKAFRTGTAHFTLLSKDNNLNHSRLGLAVPKKQIKNAVDRNRFKRICRESFRLNKHNLPNKDFVIIAKKTAQNIDNKELFNLLDKSWNRVITHFTG